MQRKFDSVIIALDTPDGQRALEMVRLLKNKISIFKVGLELFCSAGPSIIKKINEEGCKVFLDLKFLDIPTTVAGAVRASASTGAFMLNIHASGGREMMMKAKEAANAVFFDEIKKGVGLKPLLIAVTVLTSLSDRDLLETNIEKSTREQAVALAKLAKDCGMDGVVASPKEIAAIRRELGPDFVIVTPGVRPSWADANDQKRVATPGEALAAGADYIVIGRPVTAASDPAKALEDIFE
ncbi:MAG: orotidine-5'-phosphate decarboxylase [Tepidanaerobacteraceae bacterium]|jgi:orotidine-5'-phosphate decarboxylase|nr:orotidine-5'-phosphate decarboxylase [Tepidanaerobacteraceae bacterium]